MEEEVVTTSTSVGTQTSGWLAPPVAAYSGVLHLTAAQIRDTSTQTSADQEEDKEMLNAPRRLTTWDNNDLGMGPYAG
jgi:hypothetical protein